MTGFWIYILVMVLVIPLSMIGFGAYLKKSGPAKINPVFGYRTSRSMKNQETWAFAQRYCGSLWKSRGMILAPISAGSMLLFLNKSEDAIGMAGMGIVFVQIGVMIWAIGRTEAELKKHFDPEGRRRAPR